MVTSTTYMLLTFETVLPTQFSPGLQIHLCQTKHLHFHGHLPLNTSKTNSLPHFSTSTWGPASQRPQPHSSPPLPPHLADRRACGFPVLGPLSLHSTGVGLRPSSVPSGMTPIIFKLALLPLSIASLHLILLSAIRATLFHGQMGASYSSVLRIDHLSMTACHLTSARSPGSLHTTHH